MSKESSYVLIIGMVLGSALGLFFGRFLPREERVIEKVDTLIVKKEIIDTEAVLRAKMPKDAQLVPVCTLDSLKRLASNPKTIETEIPVIITKDSLVYISVPMSESLFEGSKDSVDYKITAYGYNTAIKAVSFSYPITTITKTITQPRKRLGFGMTAGAAALVTPSGKMYGGLGLSAGLTWNF